MSEEIFSEHERDALCIDKNCCEHGEGDADCVIPSSKTEAQKILGRDRDGCFSFETRTATAKVKYE